MKDLQKKNLGKYNEEDTSVTLFDCDTVTCSYIQKEKNTQKKAKKKHGVG